LKSSADSISVPGGVSGRDAVAISPFGLPVVKENGAAIAGPPRDCQEFRVRGGERSLIRPVLW
jgi:hypothetical protein